MQYFFGYDGNREILKTIGGKTNLSGFFEHTEERPDCKVFDRCRILRKYNEAVDDEGKFCCWYDIDKHYRQIDRTKPIKENAEFLMELAADQEERLCLLELGI